MSSVEQLTPVDRIPEANQADSFQSCGSNWGDLLGDRMIDLGGGDQAPLKLQNAAASENLAPKPDLEKGLKMKIKRKSKTEECHQIITPEMEKQRQNNATHYNKTEDTDSTAPSAKKARPEKTARQHSAHGKRDASVNTATVGTGIEPDCLGPCETGTSIALDGIVWLETNTGVLVVNVTWRGRTYVGTLLDSSQHEFAPPPCSNEGGNGGGHDGPAGGVEGINRWLQTQQAQQLNGRGRGQKRRGGRPLARQLPLAANSSSAAGSSSNNGGLELPQIQCPEPGCDKRFAQLQALRWHTIQQHPQPPQQQHHQKQQQPLLREEKAVDGSSVFKVPQPQPPGKPTSGLVVTVAKTCSVPAPQHKTAKPRRGSPPVLGPPSRHGGKPTVTAGRRSADPVSPAYSDISDEGGPAPMLEKVDCSDGKEQRNSLKHQLTAEPAATSAPSALLSVKTPPPLQPSRPPSAKRPPTPAPAPAAVASTSMASASPVPQQSLPTPKPSLGNSPSDGGEISSSKESLLAATVAQQRHAQLQQQQQQQQHQQVRSAPRLESPRRLPLAQGAGGVGAGGFPGPLLSPSQFAAMHAGPQEFDPFRLLSGPPGPSPSPYLSSMEALSHYAAVAAAACRPAAPGGGQPPQLPSANHHQQLHSQQHQHKIHELSRTARSPKASPPPSLLAAQFQQHHHNHQAQHHSQSQHQHHHHRAAQHPQQHLPLPPPSPHHHPGFVDPFAMQFSVASQMLHSAPSSGSHYLHHPK